MSKLEAHTSEAISKLLKHVCLHRSEIIRKILRGSSQTPRLLKETYDLNEPTNSRIKTVTRGSTTYLLRCQPIQAKLAPLIHDNTCTTTFKMIANNHSFEVDPHTLELTPYTNFEVCSDTLPRSIQLQDLTICRFRHNYRICKDSLNFKSMQNVFTPVSHDFTVREHIAAKEMLREQIVMQQEIDSIENHLFAGLTTKCLNQDCLENKSNKKPFYQRLFRSVWNNFSSFLIYTHLGRMIFIPSIIALVIAIYYAISACVMTGTNPRDFVKLLLFPGHLFMRTILKNRQNAQHVSAQKTMLKNLNDAVVSIQTFINRRRFQRTLPARVRYIAENRRLPDKRVRTLTN